jgi:plasmid maintenance system antidote protein VapI
MSKNKSDTITLTELLRQALRESESLRSVDMATGVKRQSLGLFLRGKQSLRLDMADKLCEYFGISHVQEEKKDVPK